MTDELAAGDFGAWAGAMANTRRGAAPAEVPCNGCTACCTASQFVHVDPDESDTLAHIPAAVLFPAPGLPDGHMVMGYDEHGACPMFVDGACSIYDHRPRACRIYDCRIFAATGVDAGEDGKPGVAARVRRWQFSYASPDATRSHDAMRSAAAYLRDHAQVAGSSTPLGATARALLAFKIADLFAGESEPSEGAVRAAIDRDAPSR